VRSSLHRFSTPAALIARLLRRDCPQADARLALEELARGGRLLWFLRAAPLHDIGPALAKRIEELEIDTSAYELRQVAKALKDLAASCKLRNGFLRAQLAEVVSLLAERGIPLCLINGTVSLADEVPDGYLSCAARAVPSLDIVVQHDDGEGALEVIADRGWPDASAIQQQLLDVDSPAPVNVHVWSPHSAALGFLSLEDFFDRGLRAAVSGREASVLTPQQAVQLRLVRNVIHRHRLVDFPLVELYEMANAIAARPDEIDWPGMRSIGLMNDVSRLFYAILLRLRGEFGAPVPEGTIPAEEHKAAVRILRLLDTLAAVPERLSGAASRFALIAAMPGRLMDKLNRAATVLFSEPLRGSARSSRPARIALPAKMLGLHLAVCCWKLLRS